MSKGNGKLEKLNKERENEIKPIAIRILNIIADAELPAGDNIHARDNDKYDAVAKEILLVMLANNIKYVDKDFLFQIILQPIGTIKEIVTTSLSKSLDRAIDKVFKKEFRELRLKDLDDVLKE